MQGVDVATFVAGMLGLGIVLRFVAQGVGAIVALLWACVRAV